MSKLHLFISIFLLVSMAATEPTPAADLQDIVARAPCSSIAGDRVQAKGNCEAVAQPKGLAVTLTAAPISVGLDIPSGVSYPGNGNPHRIVVDGLMAYNGSLAPEVWRIDAGDTLSVHLINHLAQSAVGATNLHTHGMLVRPTLDVKPDGKADEPVGDTIYVCTLPKGDGLQSPSAAPCLPGAQPSSTAPALAKTHRHAHQIFFGETLSEMHYRYETPLMHPEGLYWYHPHVHTLAHEQVGAGLSGLIYVKGHDADVSGGARLANGALADERFLMLKDFQVGSLTQNGDELHGKYVDAANYNSQLCGAAAGMAAVKGACFNPKGDTAWLFTVNGQLFPHLSLKAGEKQIWRIANSSANATYDLALVDANSGRPLRAQLVARDGVAAVDETTHGPMLTERILLMPGSRVEIGVDRATADALFDSSQPLEAILRSYGFYTGAGSGAGDPWPAVDLMQVSFLAEAAAPAAQIVAPTQSQHKYEPLIVKPWKPEGAPALAAHVAKSGVTALPDAIEARAQSGSEAFSLAPPSANECRRLGSEEDRIIALSITDQNTFRIGAGRARRNDPRWKDVVEEVKKNAQPFGSKSVVLCAHAGKSEYWTIFNDKTIDPKTGGLDPNGNNETHNFHIHQMKFEVVAVNDPTGRISIPLGGVQAKRKVDSFPVPTGGSIRIRVDYTPQMVGRFVFHCHILEHEDQGMMAEVEVKPH
jgi:FtsP/CotA-like multicopper oxidase with cupredoxin domain